MNDIISFNRAYMIRFKKLSESSYLTRCIFPNLAYLLSESGKNIAIEEDINGCDVMVLFIDDVKLRRLIEFCCDEEIVLEHSDISDELLLGQQLPKVISEMTLSNEYKELFDQFFEKNLSIDIILDKISKFGKDSLSKIDKQILANG